MYANWVACPSFLLKSFAGFFFVWEHFHKLKDTDKSRVIKYQLFFALKCKYSNNKSMSVWIALSLVVNSLIDVNVLRSK